VRSEVWEVRSKSFCFLHLSSRLLRLTDFYLGNRIGFRFAG